MIRKSCPACAKKIEKNFNFCPHCGESFKARNEHEQYGFLGRDDGADVTRAQPEVRLPFGLNKIMDSLVRQLEKQISEMNVDERGQKIPHGFKIKISTGQEGPQIMEEPQQKAPRVEESIPETELRRRNSLPKVDAESKVRRLADRIVYEIAAPGVKGKKNVSLNELASGIEIRAYAKNKCYVKHIPIKVEVLNYYLEGEKLFVECKA